MQKFIWSSEKRNSRHRIEGEEQREANKHHAAFRAITKSNQESVPASVEHSAETRNTST